MSNLFRNATPKRLRGRGEGRSKKGLKKRNEWTERAERVLQLSNNISNKQKQEYKLCILSYTKNGSRQSTDKGTTTNTNTKARDWLVVFSILINNKKCQQQAAYKNLIEKLIISKHIHNINNINNNNNNKDNNNSENKPLPLPLLKYNHKHIHTHTHTHTFDRKRKWPQWIAPCAVNEAFFLSK